MKPIIEILDAVHCRADKTLRLEIYNSLSYKDVNFQPARFGTKSKVQTRSFIDRRSGLFLTGLLPRVQTFLTNRKIKFKTTKSPIEKVQTSKYSMKAVLRPYQKTALQEILSKQRGVVKAPTGSGKTIIVLAACSVFRDYRILFLCHTKDLLQQTTDEAKKYLPEMRLQIIGGGMSKEFDEDADIVLATIQSFAKIPPENYMDYFGAIIVDECHHVNDRDSQFGIVLQHCIAPVKLGFTATLPEKTKDKLALEGIIGPILSEYSTTDGIKDGFLATPKITMIPIPTTQSISLNRKYKDIYKEGIVNNRLRNGRIIQATGDRVANGKSVLIMVKEVEHGDIIHDLLKKSKIKSVFIWGSTKGEQRKETKMALSNKKIKVVISTTIWREGINIPSLDVVLNACGGKSEVMTLQAIGRGFRTAKGKDSVELIDFLDPYRYLAEHCIQRLNIYYKEKWI